MGGGRGKKSRTQRKHFKDGRENVWKRSKSESDQNGDVPQKTAWQPFATQNVAFDEYYKEQRIVKPEEWDTFVQFLRTPLPAAFRINSSSQFCTDIRLQLENEFMQSLQGEIADGIETEAIRPLPWYPGNLAWHSNFSRMQLRKNQTLEKFHEFLKLENEIGNITRQEAVSMVPPLFLDVCPDHFVLDMCAAPGSKTFQLLEIIYRSAQPGKLPSGMVIANDLDVQRCNLLIHQTKRMCTANLIVTNNEAQHFPGCRSNKNSVEDSKIDFEPKMSQLLFDRVLCDVPCSGDGTLRKAPDMWRKWNSGMGNGLHCLQVLIAMRGLSLLKVGGRMVYSTCSMNPIENEAVVAELLRRCGGAVELLDVSQELPQLVRRPGLKSWKVRDKGIWLASYKDVAKYRRSGILRSMFPSGKDYTSSVDEDQNHENGCDLTSENGVEPMVDQGKADDLPEEGCDHGNPDNLVMEISEFPLERCMRIVPHDQNSGAFFIAVLQKVSPLPLIQEKPSKRDKLSYVKNDELQGKSLDQVVESHEGLELKLESALVDDSSAATSEVEKLDNEPEKVALETDVGDPLDENDTEDVEVVGNKETDTGKVAGKRKLQIQGRWKGVDPVIFFKDEVIINSIKTFYGIKGSFPFEGHLISRNLDNNHVKRIYYVSKAVKDALELNFRCGQQLKIAAVGLKMFERQSSREGSTAPCSFRISSEGLPLILPHITKQILYASQVDFKHLVQYKAIKFADFVDAEFGEKVSKLMIGCCVIVLKDSTASSDAVQELDASTIAIGCWKGRGSLSVMVTAIDCQELLERLTVRFEKNENVPEKDNNVEAQSGNGINEIEESGVVEVAMDG